MIKEEIPISKRTQLILIGSFIIIVLGTIIFFVNNWLNWQKEMESFKSSEINSRILELKNLNRGNYLVKVNIKNSIREFDLPISFEVKRDNIQVGDSLSKKSGSGRCEIYRKNVNGELSKISDFTIY
jgi:hypothetical protein